MEESKTNMRIQPNDGMVRVRGAREHNLKNVDVDIPRDALVVFTGVSVREIIAGVWNALCRSAAPLPGIGVSLRSPPVPSTDRSGGRLHRGLPPAVALQQQRGSPDDALVGRKCDDAFQSAADALLSSWRLSPGQPLLVCGIVFTIRRGGCLPEVSWPGPHLRGDREIDGSRRLADDP